MDTDLDTNRRQDRFLAVGVVLLLAFMAYRAYSPSLYLRPTEAVRPVDLNTAPRVELLQVPGLGPALTDAILTHRESGRRFESVDDLKSVKGIGPKTVDKIRTYVRAEPSVTRGKSPDLDVERLERKPYSDQPSDKLKAGDPPVNVNEAGASELMKLPGIGPTLAARIVAARAERPFGSVEDLRRVSGIGVKTLDKLRPFVRVR
jgi:competence protein ComEA